MLAERDIDLPGGYGAGPAPLAVLPLWRHRSAPLAEIVREMLVNSNNHTAEQLLRALGGSGGRPGSDAGGIAREKSELQRLGVPLGNLRLFDGSGLAPDDRIAPLTLADLIAAESRTRNGDVFVRCLARAGFEGTVAHRVLADGRGRVRAKTGHMENVNGLAGTVLTKHHGRVAFAFVVNDPRANADVVIDDEDRALDALADL
jgi:D-alanyl-D-alanine carboxypeptidase/D-alanyl-D-alanine-endopeptidase (penicillin-binding protein 4)